VRTLLVAVALGAASAASAQSGALDECGRQAADAAQMAACLQLAQSRAGDEMLATFQQVERALRLREPASAGDAVAALRRSQRDFERYVEGHCGFVHSLAGGGALGVAAAFACETDLLRQRSQALQSLLPRAPAQ